uniref:Gustatory receptor n=1 Tax=Tetranychus urticae TaxID=32264 RepID=T1KCN5_TETUR
MIENESSSETESNLFALCKPTGILAKALYSGRKVVFLCMELFLLTAFLSWNCEFWFSPSTEGKIYCSIYIIYQLIHGIFIFLLYRNRNKYIDCFNYFESNVKIDELCPSLVNYLKKHRLVKMITMLMSFACYFSVAVIVMVRHFSSNNDYLQCIDIFTFVFKMIGVSCALVFRSFFVETCLYIQSCFIQVEHQISSTKRLSIDSIRQMRRMYCTAIETTEMINSLFIPVTGFYFTVSIVESHFSFVNAIVNPSLAVMFIFIGESLSFSLTIYHIIYINHLATRINKPVYLLSFKTDLLNVSKELQILMTRITHADVGLTFLGIFVITPTCVTSLATISLTIALATPTLKTYLIA